MITIYKIIEKFKEDRESLQKILIGGLLMFVPIINILALGYLFRFTKHTMTTGKIKLPEWNNWVKLFVDGLIFIGVAIMFGLLPILLGWALSEGINVITFNYLRWFPFFPLSLAILIAPSLVLFGIFTIAKGQGMRGLLNIGDYFRTFLKFWKELVIGNLAYIGFFIIGLPLYGFAHFIGLLLLIPYTLFVLKHTQNQD